MVKRGTLHCRVAGIASCQETERVLRRQQATVGLDRCRPAEARPARHWGAGAVLLGDTAGRPGREAQGLAVLGLGPRGRAAGCLHGWPGLIWEPAAWRPAHPGAICGVQVGFVVSPLLAPHLPSLSGSVLSATGHREPDRTTLVFTGPGKRRLGPDILKRQGGCPGGGSLRRERWGFTGDGGVGPAVLTVIPETSDSSWLPREGHPVGGVAWRGDGKHSRGIWVTGPRVMGGTWWHRG